MFGYRKITTRYCLMYIKLTSVIYMCHIYRYAMNIILFVSELHWILLWKLLSYPFNGNRVYRNWLKDYFRRYSEIPFFIESHTIFACIVVWNLQKLDTILFNFLKCCRHIDNDLYQQFIYMCAELNGFSANKLIFG